MCSPEYENRLRGKKLEKIAQFARFYSTSDTFLIFLAWKYTFSYAALQTGLKALKISRFESANLRQRKTIGSGTSTNRKDPLSFFGKFAAGIEKDFHTVAKILAVLKQNIYVDYVLLLLQLYWQVCDCATNSRNEIFLQYRSKLLSTAIWRRQMLTLNL